MLAGIEVVVASAHGEEFRMVATLHDATLLHHENLICVRPVPPAAEFSSTPVSGILIAAARLVDTGADRALKLLDDLV